MVFLKDLKVTFRQYIFVQRRAEPVNSRVFSFCDSALNVLSLFFGRLETVQKQFFSTVFFCL